MQGLELEITATLLKLLLCVSRWSVLTQYIVFNESKISIML